MIVISSGRYKVFGLGLFVVWITLQLTFNTNLSNHQSRTIIDYAMLRKISPVDFGIENQNKQNG